jgi:uncharacterized protein
MIDDALIAMLRCPETRSPLRRMDSVALSRLNAGISAKQIRNRGDQLVERLIEDGLVREDGTLAYPVWDGIPMLLVDQGIPIQKGVL